MKHGHFAKGFRSMNKLRAHPIIAARDYYYSNIIYTEELRVAGDSTYFTRLRDCFTVPRIRRSNYGASTVMLAQQMCGSESYPTPKRTYSSSKSILISTRTVNIISFYSASIFERVGYTATEALYASLGYGAVQVVFTIPTLFLIDTKGRRTLCLITFPLMCIFLLAAGLSLLNDDGSRGSQIGPVVLFVYLFTIAYSMGEGPVAFQYSAEVFPTIHREQGMAWAVCINNTFAGVLGLTFPRMQTVMTPTGAFGFYAGLNLIAWGMIFCFVRETKQLVSFMPCQSSFFSPQSVDNPKFVLILCRRLRKSIRSSPCLRRSLSAMRPGLGFRTFSSATSCVRRSRSRRRSSRRLVAPTLCLRLRRVDIRVAEVPSAEMRTLKMVGGAIWLSVSLPDVRHRRLDVDTDTGF